MKRGRATVDKDCLRGLELCRVLLDEYMAARGVRITMLAPKLKRRKA